MARRGLGGSGDWSGAFASLYSFNKNEAKARQDAADQDAADRYSNGLMTDDEWMAYIREAIDREANDPKRQQQWITALRKWSTVIADKQAEHEYELGGSINQLIVHYQERLAGMVKDSNEYREVELHLNDLLDKRSGDQLTEAAEAMVRDINAGKKTYVDLKRLLQDGLADARDNSDLRKSIQNQIEQVNETLRVNALEGSFEKLQFEYDSGKISAGTYAKRLRSMAKQFEVNDPKRYYQILEAAVALEKGARSGSGGGGRSGSGGGGSASSKKAINASIDSLQAKRNTAQALLEQFEAGATKGIDPATGQVVVFSPGKVRELDTLVVRTMDQLSAAYTAKGDLSAAANAQKFKATFIATNVVAHNTWAVDDSRRELISATTKILDAAFANPDPTKAMGDVRGLAKQWSDYSNGLTKVASKTPGFGGDTKRRLPAESGETVFGSEKGLMDAVDPQFVDEASAFSTALSTLATPGLDDASAYAAISGLYSLSGQPVTASGNAASNPFVSLASKALEINGRQQGIASGDVIRIATPDGLVWARTEEISYTAPDPTNGGNAVQVTKKVPTQYRDKKGDWVDLPVDGKTSKLVDVFIDINGTPTKVQAIATLTSPQGFDTWVAGQSKIVNGVQLIAGVPLTDDQLKRISGGKSVLDLEATGLVSRSAAFQTWAVTTPGYTDSSGQIHKPQTWSQDPGTGMWYLGSLPVRGAQRDEHGMIRFSDDGPLIDWQAYGSASGVPAPYAGDNPKEMQNRLNNGEVDTSSLLGRDLLGNPTDEPVGLDDAYFDPVRDAVGGVLSDPFGSFNDAVESFTGWWNQAKRDQKAKDLRTQAEMDVESRKRPSANPADAPKGAADGLFAALGGAIKDLGESFGLNLAGTKPRPSFGGFGGPRLDDDDRFAKMGDAVAQKNKAEAPLIKLPTPSTASGPDLKPKLGDLNIKPTAPSIPVIKPPLPKVGAPQAYRPPPPNTTGAKTSGGKDDVYVPPKPPKSTGGGTAPKLL